MPRPEKPTKRDRQLNVALTCAEWERVRRDAAAASLRPVDYARAVLLAERIVTTQAHARSRFDRLALEAWKRAGNNLNQIARQLNMLGTFSQRDLDAALADLRALIDRTGRDDR